MRRRKKSPIWAEATINLTPLIDVVFVILIMFIVVAPLLNLDKVHLASGSHTLNTQALNTSPITLHVYADNTLALNNTPISLDQLKKVLPLAKKRCSQAIPQLFHDEKATFGTYQNVKSALQEAGFSQVDVLLKP